MSLLIGISNEHEFYSQHFLDEQLTNTIAEKVKAETLREKTSAEACKASPDTTSEADLYRTPWNRLDGAAREILRQIRDAQKTTDAKERIAAEVLAIRHIADCLGLPVIIPYVRQLAETGVRLPMLGEVKTPTGAPYLWILHATALGGTKDTVGSVRAEDDTDPLELCIADAQFKETFQADKKAAPFRRADWNKLLSDAVFTEENSPRWVLLCGLTQWLLIDRAKFAQRRLLRFDWTEILSRRESAVLQTTAVMLADSAFHAENGQCYLDVLDEGSYKHAHGVSEDLKYALRESIELLGNEAARQLRLKAAQDKTGIFTGKNRLRAAELSDECLRWMYRLLFLFFVESRPELNYAPVNDEDYLAGYSLESLRDLELVPLTTESERNGSYLHESITRLFKFFESGTPVNNDVLPFADATANAFTIEKLPSTLFDPAKMPLLKNVVFPNYILQHVIELMSLSRPAKGKRGQRRGRISYAHLGLNQLGAVYEALLSYRGFFAKEPLYEVKKTTTTEVDPLDPAYFVTETELEDYTDDERVYDKDPVTGDKKLRCYPKGSFIYRMAGSVREDSASYYTPEVLTKCLVEESLDVLVKQQLDELPNDKARAEKILTWRICEPAMGSAAFLNEAVNQIAELYMHYAMRSESAKPLTQPEYRKELQRVKMFLADRNIYGVDLNPVAVELAEVSLWLNALSDDKYVPWFGLQLHAGNSLIGCRREAYWRNELNGKDPRPHAVDPEGLQPGEIWHFLVPTPDMSNYKDPDVAKLKPDALKKLKDWRKKFTAKYTEPELDQLATLSIQIEMLWQTWAAKLQELDDKTTDAYSIYGHEEKTGGNLVYEAKMELLEKARHGDGTLDSGEFPRLKLVMDYWCALWFWPLNDVDKLPTRQDYFRQITTILSGLTTTVSATPAALPVAPGTQTELFAQPQQTDLFASQEITDIQKDEGDSPNWVKRRKNLEERFSAVAVVNRIVERERFFHWPLRLATVFMPQKGEHAGFDLTLGNPPWKVASWNAGDVLANKNPKYLIHDKEYSAKGIQDVVLGKRDLDADGRKFFEQFPEVYQEWLTAFESTAGARIFCSSSSMYPELEGTRTDLFKIFLPTVWRHAADNAVQGLVHPDTVYTETKGDVLRAETYRRLRKHYQFRNELKLFPDVGHPVEFSINIYGIASDKFSFDSINNLFSAKTISRCRNSSVNCPIPGKKDSDGNWNTQGHPSRILHFDNQALTTIASIFGGNPAAPLLPSSHAMELLTILEKFGQCPRRLDNYGNDLSISSCWNETTSKKDGTIRELPDNVTVFPTSPKQVIYNGPHINIGGVLHKTPDNPCFNPKTWTKIDLTYIHDDYLPRVKYLPNVDEQEYRVRADKVAWDKDQYDKAGKLVHLGTPASDFYRVALREMVGTESERTLTSGILSRFTSYIHTVEAIAFHSVDVVPKIAGYFASLPVDFYVRQQNKGHLLPTLLRGIPLPDFGSYESAIRTRALCLNCLTSYHQELWDDQFDVAMTKDRWSQTHDGLNANFFADLTSVWQRNDALRTDLDRRQALLELDVLVSLSLKLTLKELLTCYRLGFRVMKSYDEDTYYDQKGRIIFTPNGLGLRGVGLSRKAKLDDGETYAVNGAVRPKGLGFEDVHDMATGTVTRTFMDDTLPDGPKERTITYYAPFFKMNREEDYKRAWEHFEKLTQKSDN